MSTNLETKPVSPAAERDPAAVFAGALSLHAAVMKHPQSHEISEICHGGDQFLREVMRIAELFEDWACEHVAFENLTDVWPYLLEDKFGQACLQIYPDLSGLPKFAETDCLWVAELLHLTVLFDPNSKPPIPVKETVTAVVDCMYSSFEIQSVYSNGEEWEAYLGLGQLDQDAMFPIVYGVYGRSKEDDLAEHLFDRATYAEARQQLLKLFPGLVIPERPVWQF